MKELLIVGAGKIGRGVIGSLFFEAGYHLYIYGFRAERMRRLKEQGSYLVERSGEEGSERILIDNFDALDSSDSSDLIAHMKRVDLIACCVYDNVFEHICQSLKEAIIYRADHDAEPFNVLLCVNALGAPDYFETKLTEMLAGNEKATAYLKEKTGICQVLVEMPGVPAPKELLEEDPFAVSVGSTGHIEIDEDAFIGELPKVRLVNGVKRGKARVYQKVYCGNMRHCMLAFLGKARGYTYICDTYGDEWLENSVLHAFYEADAAVQAEYQFDEKDHQLFLKFTEDALKSQQIKDPIQRVAADPKTKLSRSNRFVGPALLCIKHHIVPFYLAKGIAYGFLYREESDAASVEITDYVKENGIEKAIEKYCGLGEEDWALKQLIIAQYEEACKFPVK
ncbi:MAG: mannitol dehydrogenase [Hespellia sp.]|nr:mannitol dehydrogenase [Hespellia sp.]